MSFSVQYLIFWAILFVIPGGAPEYFSNPVLDSGPDPWVIQKEGYYYFTATTGRNITLRSTTDLTSLRTATTKIVFTPPDSGHYSRNLWAPELHFLRGKWYIYFAADDGNNQNHRIYVLENESENPLEGTWTFKGKLADPGDHWAIDLTVMEFKQKLYAAWSGWSGRANGIQRIYIAELSDPWTMAGDRVEIAQPVFTWEKQGQVPEDWQKNGEVPEVLVNEAPEFLVRNGKIFIIYSANACWLDYCLGLLETEQTKNLLDPANWKKHTRPVFVQSAGDSVYAPGHNGFFKSPDGKEDWMIYHANPGPNDGCGNKRAPHIQRYYWNANGTPDFGKPASKRMIVKPAS